MCGNDIYALKGHLCAKGHQWRRDIYEGLKNKVTQNVIYARNVIYAVDRRAARHRTSPAGSPDPCRGPARTPVDSTA